MKYEDGENIMNIVIKIIYGTEKKIVGEGA